ncbi:glycosyltransferase family 2 protein [Neorhizobium sp. NCHU2750]|uniref:glycosyltransferase family 2 protein n=1 Tax=Neorhizobium sp. NCHU2750 TaxID=1825976 RepID=UPI000E71998B|nr:hypothetical protein NCHU2750_22450 [Neorhizobium sp. NCHU2750]
MTDWRHYPDRLEGDRLYRRSAMQRCGSAWRSFVDGLKRGDEAAAHINPVSAARPLAATDLAAVIVARNEMAMLPSFLLHYRRLGVSRFIVLDDRSDDGSRAYLLSQPDVDLWESSVRFAAAAGGMAWREALFAHYDAGRWYLNLDADEYLIYDRCEDRPLGELIKLLEQKNCLRLSTPMIDMYPAGPVDAAGFSGTGKMPWDVATHFDRSGYRIRLRAQNILMQGGPRQRKFGLANQLIKSPLTFWDGSSSLKRGIHKPLPYTRNFFPISGVLLHFKFFADFRKEIADAITDDQHYDNAKEYKVLAEALGAGGPLDFHSDVSEHYRGPDQMIELGFMQPLWS